MQPAFDIPAWNQVRCTTCLSLKDWNGGKSWNYRQCPDCRADYQRRYGEANRERLSEAARERYIANRDELRAKDKARKAANPEYYLAMKLRYRESRRAELAAQAREYHRLNPDAAIRAGRNRRARKAGAICRHGIGCFDNAAKTMPKKCSNCGTRKNIEADHIVPLAGGGLDCGIDNLQPLCRRCNSGKRVTDPIVYARRNGRLF